MFDTYIPALKYKVFTPFYDWFIKLTMPELAVKNFMIGLANHQENDKVLDYGSGTGTLLVLLKKKFFGLKVFGYDVDSQINDLAKNKLSKDGLEAIITPDWEVIAKQSPFDTIYSSWVFHHLTDSHKTLAFKNIFEVLKPGGIFVLADWGKPSNWLMEVLFFILQCVDNFETTSANKRGEIPNYLKNSGFSDIQLVKRQNTIMGTLYFWKVTK